MQVGNVASLQQQRHRGRGRFRAFSRILPILVVVVATLQQSTSTAFTPPSAYSGEPYVPADGFVSDEVTAIQVALAILKPIYGIEIDFEKPYNINLVNSVWEITGSLPPNAVGGVFEIWIDKKTGAILRVSHGA